MTKLARGSSKWTHGYKSFADWHGRMVAQDMFIRPEWVEFGPMVVYVRCSTKYRGLVELANLGVTHPKYLGTGNLSRFLDAYEERIPFFVENILNERLASSLFRRGYTVVLDGFAGVIPGAYSPLAVERYNPENALTGRLSLMETEHTLRELAKAYDNVIAT